KVLRELEIKKPQLNELVNTAETLKADTNRQQLQDKAPERKLTPKPNTPYCLVVKNGESSSQTSWCL
uniref:Uncharacterized protein n=1 Tax=Megaselia scalaris TaxID=36166 RepID=T1GA57_MEGSC